MCVLVLLEISRPWDLGFAEAVTAAADVFRTVRGAARSATDGSDGDVAGGEEGVELPIVTVQSATPRSPCCAMPSLLFPRRRFQRSILDFVPISALVF